MITSSPAAPALLFAGRYRLEEQLGRGVASVVQRAWDRVTAGWVAVKTFTDPRSLATERARCFERELASVRRLDHPNIVRLLDFGTASDQPFIVTELVRGGPLAAWLGNRTVPEGDLLPVIDQILRALEHAHGRGIVHRDIKPSNILIESTDDDTPFVQVCDFGLSVSGTIESWAGEPIAGTPAFMAPEQVLGDVQDARTDLYAVGVLMFVALTGQPPFSGRRAVDVLRSQVFDPAPGLRTRRPDVDERVASLVHWLLEKNPAQRCPSARVAREALARGAAARTIAPSRVTIATPALEIEARPALEPPWPSTPPFESYRPPSAAPPAPSASTDDDALPRLWSRYGTVKGDAPDGPAFWIRTAEGLILGPFGWTDLGPTLERERRAALAPEVWLSTDRERWASLETFAAWTEQPHLAPGLAPDEIEPASSSRLFRVAGRLSAQGATGRLAVRLQTSRGPITWRAFLRKGAVVRFELADAARSLPELAQSARELSPREVARDAARALEQRRNLWELWLDDERPWARGLRMRLLRVWCLAIVSHRIVGLAWAGGEPPWSGPEVAPSLLALLLHAAQTGQPRTRWRAALEAHLERRPEPTRELVTHLDRLAPDEDALASLRTLLGAATLREALETGAEPAVAYAGLASQWVRLAGETSVAVRGATGNIPPTGDLDGSRSGPASG